MISCAPSVTGHTHPQCELRSEEGRPQREAALHTERC